MTYDEKKVKKILNESDSDVNKKCEILKFDKKHEYCDCSFYYGNYIKTSRKILTRILGKPQHTGSDECEWLSSSVEWWKMLKLSDIIIPFKLYDYNYSDALDDENAIVYWRIGTENDKKKEQKIVQKYLLNLLNNTNLSVCDNR